MGIIKRKLCQEATNKNYTVKNKSFSREQHYIEFLYLNKKKRWMNTLEQN